MKKLATHSKNSKRTFFNINFVCMGFVRVLLDILAGAIGGTAFIVLLIAAILCSLSALLAMSEENRIAFKMVSDISSHALIGFGLWLPMRGISFFGTLLTVFWAIFLRDLVSQYRLMQFIAVSVLTLLFWIAQLPKESGGLPLTVGDYTIFVIVPILIGLVKMSGGSETLTKQETGPMIPVRKFIYMLKSVLISAFPASS